MLRGRDGIPPRGIHDDNPAPGGRIDIDVVHADTGATDDFEIGRRLDHLGGHLGFTADHQRVELANDGEQFIRLQADFDGHVEGAAVGEFIDSSLGDGVGDEDFRFGHGLGKKSGNSRHPAGKRKCI